MSKTQQMLKSYQSFQNTREQKFLPQHYYQIAWQLIKRDPLLFLWRFGADVFARAIWFVPLMAVTSILVADYQQHQSYSGRDALHWLGGTIQHIQSPEFLLGALGVLLSTLLLSWVVSTWVDCGVWGTLAHGIREKSIEPIQTFVAHLQHRFLSVMGLKLLDSLIRIAFGLLMLMTLTSVVVAFQSVYFLDSSVWLRALVIAFPLAIFSTLFFLVRLTFVVVAAPMFVAGKSLGESLLEAASFTISHCWRVYRIFLFSLLLLFIPLGAYLLLSMLHNVILMTDSLHAVGWSVRIFSEILLLCSMSALSVLFSGATFVYFAEQKQIGSIAIVSDSTSIHENQNKHEKPHDRLMKILRQVSNLRTKPGLIPQGTTLRDLLPDDSPYVVSTDDVIGPVRMMDASEDNASMHGCDTSSVHDSGMDDDMIAPEFFDDHDAED